MSPPKKSKSDSINIEDLIDDEATVEDFEEYNQIYPDVDAVTKLKNHCTSCFKHLGLSLAAVPKIRLHNVLKVTVCKPCHEFYNSGEFERGEDGSELFCRWCGQGGVVFCCTNCIYVFCKECIKRNLGNSAYKKISKDPKWSCFRCDSTQLLEIRAKHHAFTNYLLNRQNYVNETAKNPTELKAMLLEDMSSCCRSAAVAATKNIIDEPPSEVEDEDWDPKPKKAGDTSSAKKGAAGKSTAKPGPSAIPTPVLEKIKRPREFSPGNAPGPLSKKQKKIEEVAKVPTPPPSAPAVANPNKPRGNTKQSATNKLKSILKQKYSTPQPQQKPPAKQKQPQQQSSENGDSGDDMDIFNLMTPIVELEIQNNENAVTEQDPIDPLSDLDSSIAALNNNINYSPWRDCSGPDINQQPQQLSPHLPQYPTNPMSYQQQQPQPAMDFGNHFMASMGFTMDSFTPPAPTPRTPAQYGMMMRNNGPTSNIPVMNRGGHMNNPRGPAITRPGLRAPGAAPGTNPDTVFHYVNGFRIDLKAASEKQLITLPDGKVIHVRRHTTGNGVTPGNNNNTNQLTADPRSLVMNPRQPVPPMVRPFNPIYSSNDMAQIRFHAPVIMRGPRPTGPPQMPVLRPTMAEVTRPRPRRKTVHRLRPPLPNASQAAPMGNTPSPQLRETLTAKLKLNELMGKLQEAINYTTNKCTTFQGTNVFKGVRRMEDIIELHTNFAYILTYAQGRFNDIIDMNEKTLAELKVKYCKDKPATIDELELVEDQTTCVNLDSDDEGTTNEKETSPIIRCKTVTEINMAGPSKTPVKKANAGPVRIKVVTPRKAVAAAAAVHSGAVISLDESDEDTETASEKSEMEDQKIVKDILDEMVKSLFAEDKENTPPVRDMGTLDDKDVSERAEVHVINEGKKKDNENQDNDPMAIDLLWIGEQVEKVVASVSSGMASASEDNSNSDKKTVEKSKDTMDIDLEKDPGSTEKSSKEKSVQGDKKGYDAIKPATTSDDSVVKDGDKKDKQEMDKVCSETKVDENNPKKLDSTDQKTIPEKQTTAEKEDKAIDKTTATNQVISLDDSKEEDSFETAVDGTESRSSANGPENTDKEASKDSSPESDKEPKNDIISLDDSSDDEDNEEVETERPVSVSVDPPTRSDTNSQSDINSNDIPCVEEEDPFADIMELDGLREATAKPMETVGLLMDTNKVNGMVNGEKNGILDESGSGDVTMDDVPEKAADPMEVDEAAVPESVQKITALEPSMDDVFTDVLETISKDIDLNEGAGFDSNGL